MNARLVLKHIVNWLRDYCERATMNGFVIGVSGGIDSALTSTLCAKTGKDTLVLNLPIYQAKQEYNRANEHILWLKRDYSNVRSCEINLTGVFQTICKTFPKNIQDGLTMANTRARMRMLTLYAFACSEKLLVAGTGNKVEDLGVGFFTKYGDGGVDISPVADLMKSEVYVLARELKIIDSILNATPTDGLWIDSRSDESQIGASYDELEWAMNALSQKTKIKNQKSKDKRQKLNERQKKVIEIYLKHRRKNLHKMQPVPVCKIPKSVSY